MSILERRLPAWWAALLVVLACVAVPGGLLSSGWGGDVYYYSHIGERIAHGKVPYHDFYLEYPPGSIPVFAAPSLVSQAHYHLLFKLLMTLCAAGAAAAGVGALTRAGAEERARTRAVVLLGVAPLALGPLYLNRYDVWPAALVAFALLALVAARFRLAFALLAAATVAKVYAIAFVPVAVIHVLRRRGPRELVRSLAAFVVLGLLATLPFAAVGFGGLGYSFYIQATRQLQVESLGAQLLVAAGHLGLYEPTSAVGAPGSSNLVGPGAGAVGVISSVVEVAAVLLVAYWYRRGPADRPRLLLAAAAAVAAFVALGKVLSPQYLVWLIPVVPLVAGGVGIAASALLVAALVMTQIAFYDSDGVAQLTAVSWLVLARDLVLVALTALLTRELVRSARA